MMILHLGPPFLAVPIENFGKIRAYGFRVMENTNHKPASQSHKAPASGQKLCVRIVQALLSKVDARQSSQTHARKDDRIFIGGGVLQGQGMQLKEDGAQRKLHKKASFNTLSRECCIMQGLRLVRYYICLA